MFTIEVLDNEKKPRERARVRFNYTEDPRIKSDDKYTNKNGIAIFYDRFVKTGKIEIFVDSKSVGTRLYVKGAEVTVTS